MAHETDRTRLAAAEVLSGLYEALADHSQFDGLIRAMDTFIDADPAGLESGSADWKAVFRQHFARVGQFLDEPAAEPRDSPIVHVDKQIVPAAVINRSLDIVAANDLLTGLLASGQKSLAGCLTSPSDVRRLEQVFQANDPSRSVLLSLSLPQESAPVFVVASPADLSVSSIQNGQFVSLRVAKATWNPELVPLLMEAYGLTTAETEILRGFVERGSVTEVAQARQRSVRTVRTQLTQVFSKLGVPGQTELALFLATLSQLLTKGKKPSDVGVDWSRSNGTDLQHISLAHQGRSLGYVRYGRRDGVPVLICHSTTPPDMTPDFRKACVDAGLRVIGVHKPGAGQSTPRPAKEGPEALSDDYRAVLAAEGLERAVIAGHCSGGLYALQFAKDYPELCSGIVLVDTGLPFAGRKEMMSLPKGIRRTFLPARYIPDVLLVPHRIFAANFRRSTAGEAQVVDYFFEDSEIDRNLVQTDRTFYEITRRTIAYSFEDVDRLVADVCRWARNWSDLLTVCGQFPTVFVHGRENNIFDATKIERFAAERAGVQAAIVEGSGQLQVYQHPDRFTAACLDLVNHNQR